MPEKNPPNRPIGYARVSNYGQTHGAQLDQLRAAGCGKIYREKVTGARGRRGNAQRTREELQCGAHDDFQAGSLIKRQAGLYSFPACLSRCDFAVPISACWNGCVLMNQLPFAIPPLKAICFAHDEAFRIPVVRTTFTFWIVHTRPMSPFTTTSVSRTSTLHD